MLGGVPYRVCYLLWCVSLVGFIPPFFLMSACSFGRIVIADDYPPCWY